jgi:hypothetical protein
MEVENIKKYNKKYYDNFKKKNADNKLHCSICNKDYSYYSKSNHNKSLQHKYNELINKSTITNMEGMEAIL